MTLITVEATIDEDGRLVIEDEIDLKGKKVLITILPTAGDGKALADEKASLAHTSALMSEPALAKYWNLPEEDEAWEHLRDL